MREHCVVLVTTEPELHDTTRALATRLAERSNAVLLFVHVVPLRRSDGVAMLHSAVDLSSPRHRAWLHAQRPSFEGVPYRPRLEVGEPDEVVEALVDSCDVEMVVVEESRRSWWGMPLGRGLAERLLHVLPCPVVVGGPRFLGEAARRPCPSEERIELSGAVELLNGLLDARVDALRCRMDQVGDAVTRIAGARSVHGVLRQSAQRGVPDRLVHLLHVELNEHMRALRAVGWRLVGQHGSWSSRGLASDDALDIGKFLRRLDRATPQTSLPLAASPDGGQLVQLAGARVPNIDGGRLVFVFDAADNFLRILGQPGPLPSLETYAFDEGGVMLSNSLFPDHLFAAGLLPDEGVQTPLRLRVAEPSAGPREAWPLTRMAAHAVLRQDGWDTHGYPDYRGTLVLGAWRWVPEYSFGVTAEIDQSRVRLRTVG